METKPAPKVPARKASLTKLDVVEKAGTDTQEGAEGSGAAEEQVKAKAAAKPVLTDEVYDEGVKLIVAGSLSIDAAVAQLVQEFSDVPRAVIEDELDKRITAAKVAADAAEKDKIAANRADEQVAVNVPRAFQIMDGGGYKLVAKGTSHLPRRLAEHPYAKANGVKVL